MAPIGWPLDSSPPLVLTGRPPAERRVARREQPRAVAGRAQAELLVGHQLGRGGGVVQLDDVEVVGPDAGLLVGLARRPARPRPALPARGRCRTPATLARTRTGSTSRRRAYVLGADDDGGGAVADRRAHEQGERPGDLPAGQHVLDGHLVAVLGVRVERAVPVVLHGDAGEVLGRGAAALHVRPGVDGVDVHEHRLLAARLGGVGGGGDRRAVQPFAVITAASPIQRFRSSSCSRSTAVPMAANDLALSGWVSFSAPTARATSTAPEPTAMHAR